MALTEELDQRFPVLSNAGAGVSLRIPPCVTFTWHCGYGYTPFMKTVNAGKFKDQCLRIMDTVARTKTPVIVTKRKRPVVKIVPYEYGFKFLCVSDGFAVSEVPEQNIENWYGQKRGWPAAAKEQMVRKIAKKYHLEVFKPPDEVTISGECRHILS
jgi:prevent-host-death family protein